MDPNATLNMLLNALVLYRENRAEVERLDEEGIDDPNNRAEQADDALAEADKLADSLECLHRWLSKGGFLPAAWSAHR